MNKPTAVGVTCGVGSLLVGARAAGFKVIGNIEWRKYYHDTDEQGRNTFTENFPNAVFPHSREQMTEDEFRRFSNADIALGHPECGNFSLLGSVNKGAKDKLLDPSDIPLFIDLIAQFKPRYFVMDDLPPSFAAFPMQEYIKRLPEFDLFPEWVSNWGYGNVQRHRNRMFMLGARKEEQWVFRAGEKEHTNTLATAIGDMGKPGKSNLANHDPTALNEKAQKNLSMRFLDDRPTWAEVIEYAKENWKPGQSMSYHAKDGTIKLKPGCKREHWDYHGASVQDGGSYKLHPIRGDNLTLRERARIQGFPDDFIFYGTKLNERGEWNPDKNTHMSKQTGKAMPIEFATFVSNQIAAHIEKRPFDCSGQRLLNPNRFVDEAKQTFCRETAGYADQTRACEECWLNRHCQIRVEKYGYLDSRTVPINRHTAPVRKPVEVSAAPRAAPIAPRAVVSRRFQDYNSVQDFNFGKGK